MVFVAHSLAAQGSLEEALPTLTQGLSLEAADAVRRAGLFAQSLYADKTLGSGEEALDHAIGMSLIVSGLKLDADVRIAALLFACPEYDPEAHAALAENFSGTVAALVAGITRLHTLRPIVNGISAHQAQLGSEDLKSQIEVLRKMLLAVVEDIRVVLLRLASRTQTLRFYAKRPESPFKKKLARETLEIYAPLANRLGVWELKWELEDLSFRFIEPEAYRSLAQQLDGKRVEREEFITGAVQKLKAELLTHGVIEAEISGRPKHIYSIWNKMRKKSLKFSEVYDIRALRIIVREVKECYTALGIVHNLWSPVPREFDDYISNPKSNHYRSLHTAVRCPDGRTLEVQIRTWEMHQHAELGIAAHWRYKEGAKTTGESYDEKIAWLRKLLLWKDEENHSSDWVEHYKKAALDETIYVMTPQGRVIDLPRGATPVDFAYHIHTDLGHRCRGAKVDGSLVSLNTALETGQCVEIIVAKQGAPSRDWLNPGLGYLLTHRARSKVKQWFATQHHEEIVSEGRQIVMRELQRVGATNLSLETLASRLGFQKIDDLFAGVVRAELSLRQIQLAAHSEMAPAAPEPEETIAIRKGKSEHSGEQGILVVGVDRLLTQLAGCCKPVPPDPIIGFVTRGKGVSIHRADCANFLHLEALYPERMIEAEWGSGGNGVYAVDIIVEAHDRQGLLRDVSEVLTREKINTTAAHTQSRQGIARMKFTVEVSRLDALRGMLNGLREVKGVIRAERVEK